jgi:type II secretory pathway pseudopilin PulG
MRTKKLLRNSAEPTLRSESTVRKVARKGISSPWQSHSELTRWKLGPGAALKLPGKGLWTLHPQFLSRSVFKSCGASASIVFQQPANFKSSQSGFSLLEIILAIVLFVGVAVAIFRLSGTSQCFSTEATSIAQQNVYATLRAQIALQGINPTAVTNLAYPALNPALNSPGTPVASSAGSDDQRNMGFFRSITSFEKSAQVPANGANRNQWGSAQRTAINYQTPESDGQTSKGIGFGYSIGSTGGAPIPPSTATPLSAPSFKFSGDLTSAPFPLNGIIAYPSNPPGTTYHFTTDGSMPTPSSPSWNNNPGWTIGNFPPRVTITAFNSDSQYSPSTPTTAAYTYTLSINFSRADGRSDLYDFTYSDLVSPASAGIVLTSYVNDVMILYTTDLSNPKSFGTVYTGAFTPDPTLFNPNATLNTIVTSIDSRYIASPITTYKLTPVMVTLPDPAIPTDNSTPVPTGSIVAIDFSDLFANPITQLDALPTDSSSDTLLITLN